MSLTTRVLIGLAAGLGLGILAAQTASPALATAATWIEPVGTLWINAIRMTVIPLVVSSLIVGVASAPDPATIGRVGGRALLLFIAFMFAAAVFAAIVAPPLLALLPIDPDAAAALRSSAAGSADRAAEGASQLPSFTEWLVSLVPINPVQAAASGAILPLIVFSVAFGVAITRLTGEPRRVLLAFLEAILAASLQLVRWILALAPIGVFALALPLAARLGLTAAGALVSFIVLASLACVAFMALVLYPAAALFGRVSLAEFARASLPAQAVAFSARSSLAALPAMIEGASTRLRLPSEITGFLLPLAASTFRTGAGVFLVIGVLFVARLYGVELSATQIFTVILTVVVTSFSIPGIPAGSVVVMVPVLLAAGLPPEGIAILLGVDTIPDMFRTATNVTGDMTVAAIVGRGRTAGDPVAPGAPELPQAPAAPAAPPQGVAATTTDVAR